MLGPWWGEAPHVIPKVTGVARKNLPPPGHPRRSFLLCFWEAKTCLAGFLQACPHKGAAWGVGQGSWSRGGRGQFSGHSPSVRATVCPISRSWWLVTASHSAPTASGLRTAPLCPGPAPQGGRGLPAQREAWSRRPALPLQPQRADVLRLPFAPLETFTRRALNQRLPQLRTLPASRQPAHPACPASSGEGPPRMAEGCVTILPSSAGEFCFCLEK